MIGSFQRLSIKTKLVLVMVVTAVGALLLPSGAILVYEVIQIRGSSVQQLSSQSQIIAASSAAALVFDDQSAADEVLAGLKAVPSIVQATLFNDKGELFAQYTAASAETDALPNLPRDVQGIRFEEGHLVVCQPVYLRGDMVGSLALVGDLREQKARLFISVIIIGWSLAAALMVATLLSSRLQRLISDPVLALADVARRITVNRDYSLRATANHHDEIGRLVVDFNEMLAEIEKRDSRLRQSEERFRQLAESIREVFWMLDVQKSQACMLYVSPGYEQIWGRPCNTVYNSPGDWTEVIHPDDRPRVKAAAATKQAAGEYDEEYRIIRPDGEVRWIHDRAFPIRDAQGCVYRIAGIAEDITVRKRLEKQILEISDREKTTFGQDLHDGLCQHLVRIGFASNVMCDELTMELHPQAQRAKKIATLVDEAITHARSLARNLYPVKLETEGLLSALEELAATVRSNYEIQVEVQSSGRHGRNDHSVAVHLYRIAQEAVINSVKHACPKHITIELRDTGEQVSMAIRDDGIGIPPKLTHGMGLHIMKYRASMIGAAFEIRGEPGRGTVVSCTSNHSTRAAIG